MQSPCIPVTLIHELRLLVNNIRKNLFNVIITKFRILTTYWDSLFIKLFGYTTALLAGSTVLKKHKEFLLFTHSCL